MSNDWNMDFFSHGPSESDEKKIRQVSIEELYDFEGHPFKVIDNDDMKELVESIREEGVREPLIIRKREEKDGYEIISGHRRKRAAQLAGLLTVPAMIVTFKNNDEAARAVISCNKRRTKLLPSEKARAYRLWMDVKNHNGVYDEEGDSADQIGTFFGESARNVMRYLRLTRLLPEFLDMVDDKRLKMAIAVNLSYLTFNSQRAVLSVYQLTGELPDAEVSKECKRLKDFGEDWYRSYLETHLAELAESSDSITVRLTDEKIGRYFQKEDGADLREAVIVRLLEQWIRNGKPDISGL